MSLGSLYGNYALNLYKMSCSFGLHDLFTAYTKLITSSFGAFVFSTEIACSTGPSLP